MPLNTRSYQDLNLLFTIHPVKKDITKLVDEADIKEAVKNLILTNHYERPFHPEIGSSVTQLLFENASPLTAVHIQRAISDCLNNFEPRIQLVQVAVNLQPDLNSYGATIVFSIVNQPQPVSVTIILERLR
jgi:phage baseplate assembly protein W